MKKHTSFILAAAVLSSHASHLSAKEAEVEVRRAISVRDARPETKASTTTADVRQGRGADDTAAAATDVRKARGVDDTAAAASDVRKARGVDDTAAAATDVRKARGVDDTAAAASDVRKGRGADDTAAAATDIRQARGTDDTAAATADVRQARGADDTAAATTDVRKARGADDAVAAATEVRQGRGADDTAAAATDVRKARGADDAAAAVPDLRHGRGADDVIVTSSGALVPTASALSAPAQTAPEIKEQADQVAFSAAQQVAQTAGLVPAAVHRSQGGHHILDVHVAGFEKMPDAGTVDLENGEIIGNLPNKQRLRFALYANAEQAKAAAALWAAPTGEDKRADGAVAASETGIISWDDASTTPDASASQKKGRITGLFLHSERMPELNDAFLRGKVIQIYGPQVKTLDDSGKPRSSARQVYWTSAPIR